VPEIEGLLADAAARVRRILGLPKEFEVLFLHPDDSVPLSEIVPGPGLKR
jgi:hypothetical protein